MFHISLFHVVDRSFCFLLALVHFVSNKKCLICKVTLGVFIKSNDEVFISERDSLMDSNNINYRNTTSMKFREKI